MLYHAVMTLGNGERFPVENIEPAHLPDVIKRTREVVFLSENLIELPPKRLVSKKTGHVVWHPDYPLIFTLDRNTKIEIEAKP